METKEDDHLMDILDGVTDNSPDTIKKTKPATVMCGGEPVIIEDPVRFRGDLQTLVMSTMNMGMLTQEEADEFMEKGSMIEVATFNQMRKAAYGDLASYKYMMDRVLGKPVNQTNSVSMSLSYEDFISKLNPSESIEPDEVFVHEDNED